MKRFAKLQDWQTLHEKDDAAMAGLLDCSRQTLQRLHKGESMPRRPTLSKLRDLTGITPAQCQEHIDAVADAPRVAPAHAEASV